MGFELKEPAACGGSPQPSKASYAWREKGNGHPLKKVYFAIRVTASPGFLKKGEPKLPSLLLMRTGDRLLLMVQIKSRRPLKNSGLRAAWWCQKASLPLPFVGVEGPWIAFLSVVFCQLKEAEILNVLIIMYVFIVFFSSTKNILLFVWFWKIFSGCHCIVLLAALQNVMAFWGHYWLLNLFLELSDFVWFIISNFIKTSMEYWEKNLWLNYNIIFSCIVSKNINSWFYFPHKRL